MDHQTTQHSWANAPDREHNLCLLVDINSVHTDLFKKKREKEIARHCNIKRISIDLYGFLKPLQKKNKNYVKFLHITIYLVAYKGPWVLV